MNKMQMAHDYALKQMESLSENSTMKSLVSVAWQYADAMQVEAEKREDKTRPEVLEEWQPDWSQAPEWANWWAIRGDLGVALWCINKPTVTDDCLLSHGGCIPAPSFGFTGSHIVERPQ